MTRVTVITNSLIEGELIPHVNSIGNRTRISTADNYKKIINKIITWKCTQKYKLERVNLTNRHNSFSHNGSVDCPVNGS